MVFETVYAACNSLFFLSTSVWLGGLVMLGITNRLIEKSMEKRRTEGRQIVRRLRGIFQRIELVTVGTAWVMTAVLLILEKIFGGAFPGTFATADAVKVGLLVIPTLAAGLSTFYLAGAIKRREGQLGSYADRNAQIRVRKDISALHAQARALTWLKTGFVAASVVVAVLAMGRPAD